MRKFHILSLIFVFGFALFLTDGFADKAGEFAHKVGGFADEAGGFVDDNFIPVENFEFPTADGAAYIQGTPEFQRILENIIGTNDFEKMRDLPPNSPDYILGTKVGLILIPTRFDPKRVYTCTGFLVGPDLFMTAHHCLHDDFGLLPLSNARIYMDYYQDHDVDPTWGGATARVLGVLQMDAFKDYALLRLDRRVGNIYGWLELDATTRVDMGQSVKLISHPRRRSKEIVRRNTEIANIPVGHPLADVPFALAYLADTEPGASGSPVFLRDGTGVIAINHSSWTSNNEVPTFNAGTLMSYILPEIEQYLTDSTTPDLVIEAPRVSKDWLPPGEPFTLSVRVKNQGVVASSTTTLRFYQSFDSSITTSDVEVGTAFVSSLAPFEASEASVTLTASASEANYYYGACVDAVANETITDNNCSTGTIVTTSTTPPVYMYWADSWADKIQRATLNGTHRTNLIVGLTHPLGIAVDVEGGHIYWTDFREESIQRANLDGSNVQTLVTGLSTSVGLAVDVEGGHIYWTNNGTHSIQRANLNGSNVQTLVTGLSGPTGIALDIAGGKMYWADWDETTDSIQRANLDGSNVQTLIPAGSGLYAPMGIALDIAGGKMYWTDSSPDRIQRANLDGSNIEILISGEDAVHIALDIAAGKMYWTAQQPSKIKRANLNGSNVETLVTGGLERPFGIALGIPPVTIPPSALIAFNPPAVENQEFTVDTPITPLQLPLGTGGTPPYTYTLLPIPDGLNFDEDTRELSGTPTTVGTTRVTYTATDARGASGALTFTITVTGTGPGPGPTPGALDVNGDGQVDILDLVWVAVSYQMRGPAVPADVNADGVVNVQDLVAVANAIDAAEVLPARLAEEVALAAEAAAALAGAAGAPRMPLSSGSGIVSGLTAHRNVAAALSDVRALAGSNARLGKWLRLLEELLQTLSEMQAIPETTALLPNYPNPFNPETWLPYHLSTDAEVILTIYDIRGVAVRELLLGYQPAGVYESRGRAAYWDGKNALGESVASGLYFYRLTAGDFTATRKMLICK